MKPPPPMPDAKPLRSPTHRHEVTAASTAVPFRSRRTARPRSEHRFSSEATAPCVPSKSCMGVRGSPLGGGNTQMGRADGLLSSPWPDRPSRHHPCRTPSHTIPATKSRAMRPAANQLSCCRFLRSSSPSSVGLPRPSEPTWPVPLVVVVGRRDSPSSMSSSSCGKEEYAGVDRQNAQDGDPEVALPDGGRASPVWA